ncbi:ubiquinone biosynthesis monooxygenase Coq7 [Basidiobolus ranarum]|uniref:5-demethoxyubiquinone hydroxylase, mitochondrial n=1 Tax=Basidiobolus ranarum TaxID=34480 RepID=A0ABR2W140_9FUNG
MSVSLFTRLPKASLCHLKARCFSTSSPLTYASSQDKSKRELTNEEKQLIAEIIRVDQAGELGANRIYQGQIAVLGRDKNLKPLLQHMLDQEKHHLATFNDLLSKYRVRPTFLWPVWSVAGFALGAGTALMGKEAAMCCTEAVESVIGNHYNDQIRELLKIDHPDVEKLRPILKQFRDEELEHLNTAVEHDAHKVNFVWFRTDFYFLLMTTKWSYLCMI